MPRYEYKVVPAPKKGRKGKGIRGSEARFSFAIEATMNEMGSEGWEYLRAETLPSVERSGLTGSTTEWRNVLVFRRPHIQDAAAFKPELLPAPTAAEHSAVAEVADDTQIDPPRELPNDISVDNGVEDTSRESAVGASLSILARARNGMRKTPEQKAEPAAKPDA